MDWTNEEVLLFIRLYERESALWNPAYHNYKNRLKLSDTWQRIANGMDCKFSVCELKAKKMSLMATYRKLATKIRNGSDPHWRPEWFAFSHMDRFLKDVYEPRPERHTNSQTEGRCSSSSLEEEEPSQETPSTEFPNRLPAHFLEVTVDEPSVQQPHRSTENNCSQIKNLFEKPEPDECSLFGEFVAKKLRSMDEETKELAMLEVHGLLYHLKRKCSNPGIQKKSNIKTEVEITQSSAKE